MTFDELMLCPLEGQLLAVADTLWHIGAREQACKIYDRADSLARAKQHLGSTAET